MAASAPSQQAGLRYFGARHGTDTHWAAIVVHNVRPPELAVNVVEIRVGNPAARVSPEQRTLRLPLGCPVRLFVLREVQVQAVLLYREVVVAIGVEALEQLVGQIA